MNGAFDVTFLTSEESLITYLLSNLSTDKLYPVGLALSNCCHRKKGCVYGKADKINKLLLFAAN